MTLHYELTLEDFRQAWRAHWRRVDKQQVGLAGCLSGIILVLLGGGLIVFSHPRPNDEGWPLVPILLGAWCLGSGTMLLINGPLTRRRIVRNSWDEHIEAYESGAETFEADERGCAITRCWMQTPIPWLGWKDLFEGRCHFLLYLSKHWFVILPKRAFASEDAMNAFRELFDRKALSARKAKGFPIGFPAAEPATAIPAPAPIAQAAFPASWFASEELRFVLIDAFTDHAGGGNPAAVVWVTRELSDAARQSLAKELNQPETAFVRPQADGRFELRWFTPTREVPLCGHATLAAAKALVTSNLVPVNSVVRFATRLSGELTCRFEGDDVLMDFPATPPQASILLGDVSKALGVEGPIDCIGTTAMNLTLRLRDAEQVRRCTPDMNEIAKWHPVGVTITAPGDEPGVDFVSRFFAPQSGIPEDPVTGSAHCTLAVYWANELGKTDFVARQLSPRGGELKVRLLGDRVELRGPAVVVMEGVLRPQLS